MSPFIKVKLYREENEQKKCKDFPGAGSTVDKNPPAKTGNMGSVMGLEDSTCCGATMEPTLLSHTVEPVLCSERTTAKRSLSTAARNSPGPRS